MPRLSILIPCLGGSAEFDGTLVSVLQHRPSKCEVIVAHTQEYADPYDLASEVEFLHCQGETTLVGLINAAIATAASPIVHVLACGMEATDGWTDAAVKHLADDDVAAVAPAVMTADGSRLVSAGVRFTAAGHRAVLHNQRLLLGGSGHLRAAIEAPTLTAGFYRRAVLEALDGFSDSVGDSLADAELALNLRDLDRRTVFEPAARILQCSAQCARNRDDAFTRGCASERLFWRNATEIGLPLALALHALAVLSDPAAILGRLVGLLEIGSVARHRRRIGEVSLRLTESSAQECPTLPLPAAAAPRRKAA